MLSRHLLEELADQRIKEQPSRQRNMGKGPKVQTSLALGEQHGDKGSWGKVSIGELEGEEKGEGLRVG